MDFCHPCRRHLNGALACPGCGTPVETLRAQQWAAPAGPAGETPGTSAPAGSADNDAYAYSGAHADDGPDDAREEREDVESDAPLGRRAARRRGREPEEGEDRHGGQSRRDRKAAAHRRRRNRTLLIVAGFVLAAGGLSLAELGLDAPGSDPRPAVAGEESVDGGAEEVEPSASASGSAPGLGEPGASPSPGASGSASASASASASGDEESEGPEEETAQASASSAPEDTPTTGPTTAPTVEDPPATDAPDPDPTTDEPEPEPEPSETCDRFLWWCT